MAYTMTHLAVAKEVNGRLGLAADLPSYFLGAISPDCVHERENYHSDIKKRSHFVISEEPWGSVTNNIEWRTHVLTSFGSYKDRPGFDFIAGYFIHILTDICNNEKIWLPFKGARRTEEVYKLYADECLRVEYALYRRFPWSGEVLGLLSKGRGLKIRSRIEAHEAESFRDFILESLNFAPETVDPQTVYMTVENNLEFIRTTADEIVCSLKNISGGEWVEC